jgi:phosphate:Na+ symporter
MNGRDLFLLIVTLLGGMALFIHGMMWMSGGLQQAAGDRLRIILRLAGRNRFSGFGFGIVLGSLIQSTATTVMLMGFVNAGLMSLEHSIAPIMGANIGTTLSMQAVSFKLGAYCYAAMTIGLLLKKLPGRASRQALGQALVGFGLLFLGIQIMSGAIVPHREALQPYLARIHGDTLPHLLSGMMISLLLTALWHSSGVTIGMCFAFIQAGVFTSFEQVYPIVLGAHVGTCSSALVACLGTHIEGRRCAFTHLFFNLTNAALAVAAKPFFFWIIPITSSDLVRQTANLHTAVMIFAAVPLLAVVPQLARLTHLLLPSRQPPPEPSFLDETLLDRPERALHAALRELQRMARLCARSFRLVPRVLLSEYTRTTLQTIRHHEQTLDDIKVSFRHYLLKIAGRSLSKRQAILVQHLDRCIVDIERIGDHIDAMCELALQRRGHPEALVDADTLAHFFRLYEAVAGLLQQIIESLNPDLPEFQTTAEALLTARTEYVRQSLNFKEEFNGKVAGRRVTPMAGMFFIELVAGLDRIVKHAKLIALAQVQPEFWIKRKKLERRVIEAPRVQPPALVDPHDYLDRLQSEDLL